MEGCIVKIVNLEIREAPDSFRVRQAWEEARGYTVLEVESPDGSFSGPLVLVATQFEGINEVRVPCQVSIGEMVGAPPEIP